MTSSATFYCSYHLFSAFYIPSNVIISLHRLCHLLILTWLRSLNRSQWKSCYYSHFKDREIWGCHSLSDLLCIRKLIKGSNPDYSESEASAFIHKAIYFYLRRATWHLKAAESKERGEVPWCAALEGLGVGMGNAEDVGQDSNYAIRWIFLFVLCLVEYRTMVSLCSQSAELDSVWDSEIWRLTPLFPWGAK